MLQRVSRNMSSNKMPRQLAGARMPVDFGRGPVCCPACEGGNYRSVSAALLIGVLHLIMQQQALAIAVGGEQKVQFASY